MVSQAAKYVVVILPAFLAWLLLYFWLIPNGSSNSKELKDMVLMLPIYGILTLALYAVGSVVYGVATFNDCSEAAKELREEIKEAKADLLRKGLKVE